MKLPPHKGRYPVGLATLTLPVSPRIFGNGRTPDGKLALKMEEIAFNVFYPAEIGKLKRPSFGIDWTPRPIQKTLQGYAVFGSMSNMTYWLLFPLMYVWAKIIKIQAYPNAPLLKPGHQEGLRNSDDSATSKKSWPLVIFSHGLCGGRTSYSQFCGNLASEGYVVIALEHRDRTGPMVPVRSEEEKRTIYKRYLLSTTVEWLPGEKPENKFALRADQLEFRRNEVYLALQAFRRLVNGDRGSLRLMDEDVFNWSEWKDMVACDNNVILTGHSFGAATCLSLLSNPPIAGHGDIPVSHVMLLDPWLDPFPTPGPVPSMEEGRPPLCVMASEGYTVLEEHFERLHWLVQEWKQSGNAQSSLMTIVRSKHAEYSDFLNLSLTTKSDWKRLVGSLIHDTAMKFINDQLDLPEVEQMKIEKVKDQKVIVGTPGHLLVHIK